MERIKQIFADFSLFDKLYLISMTLLQIVVFIMSPDTVLNITAGIAGVISVVLCAKGKTAFYFIGFVQTITYLILAWQNTFYGEVIENIFYLITMIWGIFIWKKNSETTEDGAVNVKAKIFTVKQWILAIIGTISLTIITGMWLESIGSAQAYTDAATNVLAIFAQLLMVRRYREQWLWWLIIDILCFKMWFVAENWSMVAMYTAWIVNCIYGWYNWSKLNKTQVKG